MKRIAIYGKGGGGKSMVASNLSLQFARKGLKTVQIGCDPKHDSTRSLWGGRRVVSVMDLLQDRDDDDGARLPKDEFVVDGLCGIACVEAGGPESGVGCAGLGIVTAFRIIQEEHVLDGHDVVVMDVLGDVVCGGFAMPLMKGLASEVVIVVSDTPMSMYAANNIAKAVRRYRRNGAGLVGLVANNIRKAERVLEVEALASRLGTQVLAVIPHDDDVLEAELQGTPVSELRRGGSLDNAFASLADRLLQTDGSACPAPTPMNDDDCDAFLRSLAR